MPDASLIPQDQLLTPVRGLVPLHNRRGKLFAEIDIHRWMRHARLHLKVEKVDLLAYGAIPAGVPALIAHGRDDAIGLRLEVSLRTDCTAPPPDLSPHVAAGLWDLCLCPVNDAGHVDAWLAAAKEHGVPVRLQWSLGALPSGDPADRATQWADAGVRVINLATGDPFARDVDRKRPAAECMASCEGLRVAAEACGMEVNLIGVPFCALETPAWPNVASAARTFLDHQHYQRQAYDLARKLYEHAPRLVSRALLLYLGRSVSYETAIDHGLQSWLFSKHPTLYFMAKVFRKFLRYLPLPSWPPKAIEHTEEAYTKEWRRLKDEHARRIGPACAACRLQRVCDGPGALLGFMPEVQMGDPCPSPAPLAKGQPRYYDDLDARRVAVPEAQQALAGRARAMVDGKPHTRSFSSDLCVAENTFCDAVPGAVRWFSLTAEEKRSIEMPTLTAPVTIAVTVGGGIAAQAGFAIGRHARVVCPMETHSHKLVLHVEPDGSYVLLRDGVLMRPTEFDGDVYVPSRLPTVFRPRLSLWDIDGSLFTQNPVVWDEAMVDDVAREDVLFSIVITCVRFTRRLQAVLRALSRQEGIDLARVEVIIAYVTGMDATDDLITSMALTHPDLRIIRSPFPERHAKAKGFILNESAKAASGKWVMFLDADVVVPTDMLARIEAEGGDAPYVAPDRRKMVPPAQTAAVLLGELEPWRDWQAIIEGPGEMRVKEAYLPVGFLQCVRRDCLGAVPYPEYDHFEGADWDFIVSVNRQFGEGVWLGNTAVLHLDHGGSQWWGAQRHF